MSFDLLSLYTNKVSSYKEFPLTNGYTSSTPPSPNLQVDPNIEISPGEVTPPHHFRELLENTTYQLPLYPTTLLLATDIELTVDVPFVFHTLPTLVKFSYDPHITGGFGPFSFGPLHRASAGDMKFRVGIRDNKISITLPGTQLIGYVCDVVPQHPRENATNSHRSTRSAEQETGSEFDQWLFSKKNKHLNLKIFHKELHPTNQPIHLTESLIEEVKQNTPMIISPTAPLNIYYNTTL